MPLTQLDSVAALIVLDLQKGIVHRSGLPSIGEIVSRSARLAKAFRSHRLPVALVNVVGAAPGRTDEHRPKFDFTPDWTELVPELAGEVSDIRVSKQRPGAFVGTKLRDVLERRHVTQVFLTGIATSNAVIATARSAFDYGYNVVFITDAMMDRDPATHEYFTERVFPRLGETTTADHVLARLGQ